MSSKVKDANWRTSFGLSPNGGLTDGVLFIPESISLSREKASFLIDLALYKSIKKELFPSAGNRMSETLNFLNTSNEKIEI